MLLTSFFLFFSIDSASHNYVFGQFFYSFEKSSLANIFFPFRNFIVDYCIEILQWYKLWQIYQFQFSASWRGRSCWDIKALPVDITQFFWFARFLVCLLQVGIFTGKATSWVIAEKSMFLGRKKLFSQRMGPEKYASNAWVTRRFSSSYVSLLVRRVFHHAFTTKVNSYGARWWCKVHLLGAVEQQKNLILSLQGLVFSEIPWRTALFA